MMKRGELASKTGSQSQETVCEHIMDCGKGTGSLRDAT